MIEDNPFAKPPPQYAGPPTFYPEDTMMVRVRGLKPGYCAAVLKAIGEGKFETAIYDGEWYVCPGEMFELAGPGADLDDPESRDYIPEAAKVRRSS